jgi:formylglycine-generating enzyme required for sulfatase activity
MMGSKLSPKVAAKKYGGTEECCETEHPRHNVTISRQFYLQSTPVTQGQWKKVMVNNPSNFKDYGDDYPVENISWDDAIDFIKKLNEKEKTDEYRLPTEAEWEYACRAGATAEFSFGDDADKIDEHAWHIDNSGDSAQPVGQKEPNVWGIYDMHGNVWEWVEDDWHNNYKGAPPDGGAWIDKPRGDSRITRGGSWADVVSYCRSALRWPWAADFHNSDLGFRLCRSVALGS